MTLHPTPHRFSDEIGDLVWCNFDILEPLPRQENLGFQVVDFFIEALKKFLGRPGVVENPIDRFYPFL